MENTIKITNVTIVENSVVISLNRYNELVEKEKAFNKKLIYTKGSFISWGGKSTDTVFTDDEAAKQLSIDLANSNNEIIKLTYKIKNLNNINIVPINSKIELIPLWIRRIFKAV